MKSSPERRAAALPWRDTKQLYGRITRWLHWSMAVLLLWQFTGMGLRLLLGRDSIAGFFVRLHQPVGTALLGLVVLRVIWALVNRHNRPPHDDGLLGRAAKLGHLALYLLMAIIPSIALVRAWGAQRAFAPYGFEIFPARAQDIKWTADLAAALHGELAWLLAALILGHVIMVAFHQAMWRDGTLARMAGLNRKRKRAP